MKGLLFWFGFGFFSADGNKEGEGGKKYYRGRFFDCSPHVPKYHLDSYC